MYLCTNGPSCSIKGDRYVLTVPSGKERVEIALTLSQLLELSRATTWAARELIDQNRANAQVIALPRKKGAKRHA